MPIGEGTARRLTEADKKLVSEMRNDGASYQLIADVVGVSKESIKCRLSSKRREGRRKTRRKYLDAHPGYSKKWLEAHPNYLRDNHRKHILNTPGGKIRGLNKRPYPSSNECELCSKQAKVLAYHHWDDSNPSIGLWLCPECHKVAGFLDSPESSTVEEEYLILKEQAAEQVAIARIQDKVRSIL